MQSDMALTALVLLVLHFHSAITITGAEGRKMGGVDRLRTDELTNIARAKQTEAEQREADLVAGLPGQPGSEEIKQYAGYVTVNESHGRALFYWFVEASESAASKPLLLWLNGGPGCSSVGYGQLEEIGPFGVRRGGVALSLNNYTWNKEANLLFIESPAGVGFSYSNTSTDYNQFGDTQTALDSYSFLLGWYERFPEYKNRDFYIVGESYAGHYVPQLAKLIVDMKNPEIALNGIMMGNAVIDDTYDSKGIIDYAWSHAIISDAFYKKLSGACKDYSTEDLSNEGCRGLYLSLFNNQYSIIDVYSVFSDNCLDASNSFTNKPTSLSILSKGIPISILSQLRGGGYDPCIDNYVSTYLNQRSVQEALHVKKTNWTACSSKIGSWKDSSSSILPILKELMASGLRIWYYSGDWDGRIPFISTQYSLDSLALPLKVDRYAWYHEKQVGGWAQVYNGITFATIRGAGHMVPSFQPGRALTLFSHFLSGTPLPTS